MEFVNREKEIEFLEESYKEKKPQLIIVYGRRRVGKSCILTHFKKAKPGIYYLCSKGNEAEQIRFLSREFGEFFKDDALLLNPFNDWHSLFLYLNKKVKNERIVWIVDEFPFLVKSNPAISSVFQKYWDEYLSKTRTMLVLCGSSISMMESETLAYKAPLYGRRTGQWKVEPLKFKEATKFAPNKNMEEMINVYSITGGVPFYLVELDLEKSAMQNIKERIAKKGKVLYEEGDFLIKEELREPATYFSILNAIASGKTKQAEIANAIRMPATAIPRYLNTLIRLGFIERETPVTEKPRTKKGLYKINDNFLHFWFKFIYPNKGNIEEENKEAIERALKQFNSFVGKAFEEIAMEALEFLAPFNAEKTGRWWGAYRDKTGQRKPVEIDIIALNEKNREMLFCECKWKRGVNAEKILKELKEKSQHVQWFNEKRKEHYAIFAKSFKKRVKEKNTHCYDLKDLEKAFKK